MYGVNDITSIKASIKTGEHTVTGYFSCVHRAYLALRCWYAFAYSTHGKPMPVSIAFTVGSERIGGIYTSDKSVFEYMEFVSWLAGLIGDRDLLAVVPLNRPAEVHVSWDYLHRYLAVQRRNRKLTDSRWRTSRHSFVIERTNSRASLIRLLTGYKWSFSFQDISGGEWHYYYNPDLAAIHHNLILTALDNRLARPENFLTQEDALNGLRQFYKLHPEYLERISPYHIKRIVRLMQPGSGYMVAREARQLVMLFGEDKTRQFLDDVLLEVSGWLNGARQMFKTTALDS